MAVLRTKLEMLEAQLARERDLRDQEREGVEQERETVRETVADLRKRLDRAEERMLVLSASPIPSVAPLATEFTSSASFGSPAHAKPLVGFLSRLLGRA